MDVQRQISFFIAIVLLFVTASLAQEVRTDYDRSADFTQNKTYSWERVQTQNALWADRIKAAVNSALAVKGWVQVESGGSVSIVAALPSGSEESIGTCV